MSAASASCCARVDPIPWPASKSTRSRTGLPLVLAACAASTQWGHAEVTQAAAGRTIEIAASHAFAPNSVTVYAGEVVRLRFTRTTSRSCAREVVINLDGGHQIRRELPVNVPVDVALRFDRPGELGFSCGMAMMGGTIEVKPPR